jgi:hypothetical protein
VDRAAAKAGGWLYIVLGLNAGSEREILIDSKLCGGDNEGWL